MSAPFCPFPEAIPESVQRTLNASANALSKKTGRASWKIGRALEATYRETGLITIEKTRKK